MKTYQEWIKTSGDKGEYATKALFLDKIIDKGTIFSSRIGDLMGHALSRALVENGVRPTHLEIESERDVFWRGTEYVAALKTVQGDLPIEYLNVAYKAWQDAEGRVDMWERKSLIQYLKHWLRRTFK